MAGCTQVKVAFYLRLWGVKGKEERSVCKTNIKIPINYSCIELKKLGEEKNTSSRQTFVKVIF